MTDLSRFEGEHPGLRWLVENEPELADRNLRWVALTETGPIDDAEDLGELVERRGTDGPLYHFVNFAIDRQTDRVILPRRP